LLKPQRESSVLSGDLTRRDVFMGETPPETHCIQKGERVRANVHSLLTRRGRKGPQAATRASPYFHKKIITHAAKNVGRNQEEGFLAAQGEERSTSSRKNREMSPHGAREPAHRQKPGKLEMKKEGERKKE